MASFPGASYDAWKTTPPEDSPEPDDAYDFGYEDEPRGLCDEEE